MEYVKARERKKNKIHNERKKKINTLYKQDEKNNNDNKDTIDKTKEK